jgi:hypothetical protein
MTSFTTGSQFKELSSRLCGLALVIIVDLNDKREKGESFVIRILLFVCMCVPPAFSSSQCQLNSEEKCNKEMAGLLNCDSYYLSPLSCSWLFEHNLKQEREREPYQELV